MEWIKLNVWFTENIQSLRKNNYLWVKSIQNKYNICHAIIPYTNGAIYQFEVVYSFSKNMYF